MSKSNGKHDAALRALRAFGLAYPGTHTKSPWPGHLDLAVDDKTFAYLSLEGEPLSISCKLPSSCEEALMLPGTKPTAYGLGKWGWVSMRFEPDDDIPVEMLEDWIDESYRAQASKKRLRALAAPSAPSKPVARKTTARKPAAKKSAAKNSTTRKATSKESSPKKPTRTSR